MGIQINGNTNNINAGIGSLSIEDINELDIVGVATAANFKTGVSNLHSLGLTLSGGQLDVGSNIKIGTAGVVTATSFVGSGANLTSLPAQATIANNADNRVITGGSGVNLNGEANLTFDGDSLLLLSSTNGRRVSFAGGGTSHYMKFDNTLNGIILNGYGGIAFETNGTNERLRIESDGDICIGRTSGLSDAKVSIQCDAGEAGIAVQLNTSSGASNLLMAYSSSGPNVASITVDPDASPGLMFNVWDGSSTTERLRIKSNGQIVLGSDGSNSELTFSQDGSTGVILNSTTTGFGGYNTFTVNSAQFVHKYGGNERLRIESGGNVVLKRGGISATPSVEIFGSGNASDADADNLRIHNWGDSSGDYWKLGVNLGMDANGNSSKPSNTLKGAAVTIDGRYGRLFLQTSPSSSSTVYDALIADSAGRVTKPNQPCCMAYNAQGQHIAGGATAAFNSTRFNIGTHYNTSNGRFTAPIAGRYLVAYSGLHDYQGQSTTGFTIQLNGSNFDGGEAYDQVYGTSSSEQCQLAKTLILNMSVNDYVSIYVRSSGTSIHQRYGSFSVCLLT